MKVLGADFVLYEVNDFQRALTFYRDTLGLRVLKVREEWERAEFDLPPTTLAIACPRKLMGRPANTGGCSITLAVPDVAAAIEELKAKGVKILYGPVDTPVCEMGGFEDPDGNGIGLHHRKDGTVG